MPRPCPRLRPSKRTPQPNPYPRRPTPHRNVARRQLTALRTALRWDVVPVITEWDPRFNTGAGAGRGRVTWGKTCYKTAPCTALVSPACRYEHLQHSLLLVPPCRFNPQGATQLHCCCCCCYCCTLLQTRRCWWSASSTPSTAATSSNPRASPTPPRARSGRAPSDPLNCVPSLRGRQAQRTALLLAGTLLCLHRPIFVLLSAI